MYTALCNNADCSHRHVIIIIIIMGLRSAEHRPGSQSWNAWCTCRWSRRRHTCRHCWSRSAWAHNDRSSWWPNLHEELFHAKPLANHTHNNNPRIYQSLNPGPSHYYPIVQSKPHNTISINTFCRRTNPGRGPMSYFMLSPTHTYKISP